MPASAQSGRSSGVEHNLAKVGVEGSNPFARSRPKRPPISVIESSHFLCGSPKPRPRSTRAMKEKRINPEDALILRTAPLATPTDLSADSVRDISAALNALLAD